MASETSRSSQNQNRSTPQSSASSSTNNSPSSSSLTNSIIQGAILLFCLGLIFHGIMSGSAEKALPANLSQHVSKARLLIQERLNGLVSIVTRVFAQENSGASSEFDEKVPEISNDTELTQALAKSDRVFFMAYAPWCGHCTRMKPQFIEFQQLIEKTFPEESIRVYRYNAVKENCTDCKIKLFANLIKGFPTLLLVHQNNVVVPYEGARDAKSMMSFVKESFVPPKQASSESDITKHIKDIDISCVVYYPSKTMSFDDAVKSSLGLSKSNIIFTDDMDKIKELIPDNFDSSKLQIMVFKSQEFKGIMPEYDDSDVNKPNPSLLLNMIANDSYGKFSDKNFMSSKLPSIFILVRLAEECPDGDSDCLMYQSNLPSIIKQSLKDPKLLGRVVALVLDPKLPDNNMIASIVGMNTANTNCLLLFDTLKNTRHGMCQISQTNRFTPEELNRFFVSALDGSIAETVNTNLLKLDQGIMATVSKFDLPSYVNHHDKILLYVFTVQKHGREDSDKLKDMKFPGFAIAELDMTIDQMIDVGGKSINVADAPQVLMIQSGKFVKSYKGDISHENLENFVNPSETEVDSKAEDL